MKSSDVPKLTDLAAQWHSIPKSDEVLRATQEQLRALQEMHLERSTRAYNQLRIRATQALMTAAGRSAGNVRFLLGQAIAWLGTTGDLEDLHVAFVQGDANAGENTIIALRDACLGELQRDWRRFLIQQYCGSWEVRCAVAAEWLAGQAEGVAASMQAWELADNIDEIIESVGAGERLLGQLKTAGRRALGPC